MDWQNFGAGMAILAIVGGFLGWVVRLSIKSSFSDLSKDFATKDLVNDKIKTHEQIHHK